MTRLNPQPFIYSEVELHAIARAMEQDPDKREAARFVRKAADLVAEAEKRVRDREREAENV